MGTFEPALQALLNTYPNTNVTSALQPVSSGDFAAQAQKHLSRKALGGAIGVITTMEHRVILVERTAMHPGWALPGGTVEQGEDFASAFLREVHEEIGIDLVDLQLREIEMKTFLSPQGETLKFALAVFAASTEISILPDATHNAASEGLRASLFHIDALPDNMILGDRNKTIAYVQRPTDF
ncbi:NUDIX hydrolase [Agrobacterium fabrum]|jgi:ADP-ribose pyrophosphatase YjhB (NUDIX family)|uniref:NUDIX hydrolase n=1 Tax=Agrobacterium fabrum TaxID=1176649 RepID=UPI0027401598|nr:NUDIX domain-containing protein [Agrobacterium fabrum]WLP54020.1 NUDIX domain-containing protein [Agrobacterium fabrum]